MSNDKEGEGEAYTAASGRSSSAVVPGKTRGSLAGEESPLKEAMYGYVSGFAFGLTSPVVGHPFDTVKTQMQAYGANQKQSPFQVARSIYQTAGIRGFYAGFIPPLLGSAVHRGAQFSAYAGAYAYCQEYPFLASEIPFTFGLRPSIFIGSVVAAAARSAIESPLDFMKVRRQTGQSFLLDTRDTSIRSFVSVRQLAHLYTGFMPTFLRTCGLLSAFFSLVDYSVRYVPDVINAPLFGPFFKGGICATVAWGFAFPFETVKSRIQSADKDRYKGVGTHKVLAEIVREGGVKALYRGFSAGCARSILANGASMTVYMMMQDMLRKP